MAYDVIVLGSGPGGYPAAIRASQLGFKVAIIEKESLGGVCLNWGCIPTKALIKSANVFEYVKHSTNYGINATGTADFGAVIKRSRGVADKMSKGVQFLMKKNKIDVIMGYGKIAAKGKIEVTAADGSKQIVEAKNIVIATGGRAKQLPNLPIDGKKIIGYREAMVLPQQPKSMIIVGSGAIGVEFAYVYSSLGTKVTIVEFLPRIVPVEDEDISKELEKQYKKNEPSKEQKMNEKEFWAALKPVESKPLLYRLYYNDAGNPLYFSQEDLPGNYIDVDYKTYINPPKYIRVVDKKLVILEDTAVTKLYPGKSGTCCHPQDITIIVDESTQHIKWSLK